VRNSSLGAAIVAVVILSSVSCREESPPAAAGTRTVRAAVVRTVVLPDEVSGFGSLSFLKKVDVSSPQDAVIGALPYREGDKVKSGTLVARLRNPQIELAVRRAENGVAQSEAAVALADAKLFEGHLAVESRLLGIEKSALELAQAKRELSESERKHADQETLYQAGGLPEESIRSNRFSIASAKERLALMEKDMEISLIGLRDEDLLARGMTVPKDGAARKRAVVLLATETLLAEKSAVLASLGAAQKELESARMALQELALTAPVDGVVGARYFEAGERVKRDDKLLTIMDVGSLYAVAPIREPEAMRLSAGMKATVRVDAVGSSYEGLVDLISPVADAQSASFTVRVSLRDPKGRLKPGMFARVSIVAGPARRVLLVPELALLDRSGDSGRVFVVLGGIVHGKDIEVGEALEGGRVVLSGLAEGEVVVEKPDPGLKEGDSVTISR
jgi:RND family efflux transporter MFP subunit